MGRPKLWGPDEWSMDEGRGVQDGDIKITWRAGCMCLAVRIAGAWSGDYFLRASTAGAPNGVAVLDADGKVPSSALPAAQQGIVFGTTAGTACEGNDVRLSNARPPMTHEHAQADIVGLLTDLAGKAATVHGHAIADVSLLQAVLDGKADRSHVHAQADVSGLSVDLAARQATSEKGASNGYASLGVDGKVPAAQLPSAGSGWTLILKPSDTVRVNNTLQADPDLQCAVAASGKYAVRGRVHFDTGATADFKWRHAGPSSPALVRIRRCWMLPGTTALAGIAVDQAFSAADLALIGSGTNGGWIDFDGIIVAGASNGTFSVNWAQNTTTAGQNTIVRAGSWLEWRQV